MQWKGSSALGLGTDLDMIPPALLEVSSILIFLIFPVTTWSTIYAYGGSQRANKAMYSLMHCSSPFPFYYNQAALFILLDNIEGTIWLLMWLHGCLEPHQHPFHWFVCIVSKKLTLTLHPVFKQCLAISEWPSGTMNGCLPHSHVSKGLKSHLTYLFYSQYLSERTLQRMLCSGGRRWRHRLWWSQGWMQ